MKVKLAIAYDGTHFSGWATQPGKETVQGHLQKALALIFKSEIALYGSGRTDAGVHAVGQVAHFDLPEQSRMPVDKVAIALNTKLPPEIRVLSSEEVSADFHARFSAVRKQYTYHLCTTPVLLPHHFQRVWHHPQPFEMELLEKALLTFQGIHDFRHFSALRGNESAETSYERTIFRAEVEQDSGLLKIHFEGNGFLYKMVRILVGTALEAAKGKISPEKLSEMLSDPLSISSEQKYCAPASGLYLTKVTY